MGCVVKLIFEQGDIVSINFDPSARHEPAGRHYAIVVSPWHINTRCSLTTVVPVTSADNGYPLHVRLAEGNDIHGFAQCEALRAIDFGARTGAVERVGIVDDDTLARIMGTILVVLGLDYDM